MKRADKFLEHSLQILESRGKEYEAPNGERSFHKVVDIFNILRSKDLLPSDIALILQILKDVRQYAKPGLHHDSVLDCLTYAALKAELLSEEDDHGKD